MRRAAIRAAVRRSLAGIKYVTPVPPRAARGVVAEIYAQAERDFGVLAPPLVLHSPAPAALASCWVLVRETLVAPGPVDRAARETVAAAVSAGNACPYCVTIHSSALRRILGPRAPAEMTSEADIADIPDPRLRDIARWARWSGRLDAEPRLGPSFPTAHLGELAAVAVAFQYLNRMVTIFLEESPLPRQVPGPVAARLMLMTAAVMLAPGDDVRAAAALDLLPAAEPPAELSWAAGAGQAGVALARAVAAVEDASASVVSQPVREVVGQQLATWNGLPRGVSRSWVEGAVSGLGRGRAAARLALLAALAPYQVTPADVEEFRSGQPADEALILLTSWASMTAARTVGSWLRQPSAS